MFFTVLAPASWPTCFMCRANGLNFPKTQHFREARTRELHYFALPLNPSSRVFHALGIKTLINHLFYKFVYWRNIS